MEVGEMLLRTLFVGVAATLLMDVSALIRARVLGSTSLDYRLVGRWLGHLLHGQFCHASIVTAPRVRHERLVGWVFHYLTGAVFAMLLVVVQGPAWLCSPPLMPALLTGLISVAAPWLIMQPAFGLGIAASRAAAPHVARRKTVIAHLTFGVGLFGAGWLLMRFFPSSLCLG